MKSKLLAVVAVVVPLLAVSNVARADTIPISVNVDLTAGNPNIDPNVDFLGFCCSLTPAFATVDATFVLPVGFTNAALNTTLFQADDRAVLQLNGTNVSNTGIFNPPLTSPPPPSAVGGFSFDGINNAPFTFVNSNDSTVFALIVGPFIAGTNTLHFIINNTFNGILDGDPNPLVAGNPMFVAFEGSVTFDAAATPLPATLPLFATGLAGFGLLVRRRKQKQLAA